MSHLLTGIKYLDAHMLLITFWAAGVQPLLVLLCNIKVAASRRSLNLVLYKKLWWQWGDGLWSNLPQCFPETDVNLVQQEVVTEERKKQEESLLLYLTLRTTRGQCWVWQLHPIFCKLFHLFSLFSAVAAVPWRSSHDFTTRCPFILHTGPLIRNLLMLAKRWR